MRQGTRLEVAYFDQMRSALDLDATLADTHQPGQRMGRDRRRGSKHVMSYLTDFLFSPERANSPVRTLSGGERNRVLLARLFALPANVLVLDEPTNDLDIDTLELLEELLQSLRRHGVPGQPRPALPRQRRHQHDRLGRRRSRRAAGASTKAATRTGSCRSARRRPARCGREAAATPARRRCRRVGASRRGVDSRARRSGACQDGRRAKPRKLSYKEQRELDALPARIEALEVEQKELAALLASAELYAEDPVRAEAAQMRYAQIDDELLAALERWEVLGTP